MLQHEKLRLNTEQGIPATPSRRWHFGAGRYDRHKPVNYIFYLCLFQFVCRFLSAQNYSHSVLKILLYKSRAGQNTLYKVFEILNTKYFWKRISNTKIPNTFSKVFQLPKYQIRILKYFLKIQNTDKATLTHNQIFLQKLLSVWQSAITCDFLWIVSITVHASCKFLGMPSRKW